jgi:CheY-like chemotaxis protein
MQCPRCHAEINVLPDPGGSLVCPGCGVRLMTRAAQLRSGTGGSLPAGSAPAASPAGEPPRPSTTLPPGTPLKKIPRPGEDTARSSTGRSGPPAAQSGETPASGMPAISRAVLGSNGGASLDTVLAELRAIRETQVQILALLIEKTSGESRVQETFAGFEEARPLAPVRTRRRKTVLLIDDDPATREAAVAELEQAQVPVRAVADGNAGIQAIATEKPDVIAIELGLAGSMAAKDVINMIKATMEWVDIPILLYTRLPLESQKQARAEHGADDLVLKRSGPAALVSRVITIFRRGA